MKKLLCFIVVLAMLLPLSFTAVIAAEAQEDIVMTIGGDETERNFTWFHSSTEGQLEISVATSSGLASSYDVIPSAVFKTANQRTNVHRASVFGLLPDTRYAYRVRNGSNVSKVFYFTTDPDDSFSFIFVGDPQLGGSGNSTSDETKWANTLRVITQKFPETSLLVSAGDQVERGNIELQFSQFLSSDYIRSLALAPSIGNHEGTKSSSSTDSIYLYTEHFNLPNTLTTGKLEGKDDTGSNYYYTYNNVLFIHLNTNSLDFDAHKRFMENAIELNPQATWRVVVMHYALYGAGEYFLEDPIIQRREALEPIFNELDIDVVLNGHEHVYARSHIIKNGVADTPSGTKASVTDPDGILYLTGGSSTGSKYYELLPDESAPHVAYKLKNNSLFTNIEVTEDSFKLTTYRVSDGAAIDTFEIKKTDVNAPVIDENHVHTPTDWIVHSLASLRYDGLKIRRCTVCGAVAESEVLPSFLTDPNNTNLALDKSYTISGNGKPYTKYIANLTDGEMATQISYDHRWFTLYYNAGYPDDINAPNGVGYVTIDLENVHQITEVKIHAIDLQGDSGIKKPNWMKVYLSNDGENFGEAIDVNMPEAEKNVGFYATATVNRAARYVRVEVSLNGTFAFFNEIEVHGDKNGIDYEPEYTLGDVNDDGKVDQYDYILVKRHYFGTRVLSDAETKPADVNKDGKVDQYDYILICRHYFGTYAIG